MLDEPVEFLILDYKRPEEAYALLNSIRKNSSFDHKITFLDNGSNDSYSEAFKNQGLIDNLIVNKKNVGCGAGTIQLFAQCFADYAFYLQVDHVQIAKIDQVVLDYMIKLIKEDGFCYLDLAGNQGHGKYSERAQFIQPHFYNSIPKSIGGPGYWTDIKWTEECMQNYIEENNLNFKSLYLQHEGRNYPFFADCGKWSIREEKDGTAWKYRTDIKRVSLVSGTPLLKPLYIPFSQEQWEEIKATKECKDVLPFGWKDCTFKCWD
jgi:hypothetical protein